jgi:O-antigen/teichoic acid export membrane protein
MLALRGGRAQSLFALGFASAVNAVLLAVAGLLVARYVTVEEYGAIRLISSYSIVFVVAAGATLHDAVAGTLGQSHRSDYGVVVNTGFLLTVATSAAFVAAAVLLSIYLAGVPETVRDAVPLLLLFAPFAVVTILINSAMQVAAPSHDLAISTLLAAIVASLSLCFGAGLGGYEGWLAGRMTSWLLVFLLTAVIFVRRVPIGTRWFDVGTAKVLVGFSRVQIFSALLSLIVSSIDVIVVERVAGLAEAGFYGLALLIARSTDFFAGAIGRVYFRDIAIGEEGAKRAYFWLTVIVGVLFALLLYFVAPIFINSVYGQKYDHAIPMLQWLVAGLPFSFACSAISTINVAQRHPKRSVATSIISALSMLVLLYLFVPSFLGVGAAIAVAASRVVTACFGGWLIIKST